MKENKRRGSEGKSSYDHKEKNEKVKKKKVKDNKEKTMTRK